MNEHAMPGSKGKAERPRIGARWRGIVMPVLGLAAFCALIALGTWQVQRLHWKENLLATIAERMASDPVPLDAVEDMHAAGKAIEYRPVRVSGTFDNTKERHFFATYKGVSGYFVYTPLTTADGQSVFINRGFVPFDLKEPSSRPGSLVTGRVAISGLARVAPAEKPSFIVPDNDIAKNIFYWKDLSAMAQSSGIEPDGRLVPFFIDADRGTDPKSLPVGGVTVVDLPNNHLQYAFTWYGLAGVLVIISGLSLWRRKRKD